MQEALEEAIDCLGSVIAHCMKEQLAIPAPSKPKRGQRLFPVPFWISAKLALYLTMREQGGSNSALARRMNVSETIVRRMQDPGQGTRLRKLQAALDTLGKRLVVALGDAA